MVLPTYTLNTIVPPEDFNAFLRPKFNKNATEEESPGNLRRLTDDALANEAGNIKPQWQGFRDELAVFAGSGLSVNYSGGVAYSTNYQPLLVAPGQIAVANNAESFIFVDNTGVVRSSTRAPRTAFRMALVTAVGGTITAIADRRRRFQVAPPFSHLRVLGGNAESSDYDLSGSDTLSGKRTFRSFRLRSTAALTVRQFLHLEVAEDLVIDTGATVTITPYAPGGQGYSGVNAALIGGFPGVGPGTSTLNLPTEIYEDLDWYPCGSGAGSGYGGTVSATSSDSANFIRLASGGPGGGGILIECGGTVTINGSIIARGGDATTGSSSLAGNTNLVITGAGGGTGGKIKILCPNSITLGATSILDVRGGRGSNAIARGGGGGGGGGGRVIIISPVVNLIQGFQTLVSGGALGLGNADAARGATAGASFGGLGGATGTVAGSNDGLAGQPGLLSIQYRMP